MILPDICLFRSKNRFILCRVRERGQSVRQVPFVGWTDGGNPFMGENIGNGTSFAWTAGDGMNGRRNAEECNAALREKMLYLLPEAARLESVLPGLTLIRHDGERKTMKCFYHPMAALIVQGVKRSVIGKREVCYGEGQCMVIGVDMPGVFHIMEASAQKPFLSLAVSLDRHVITRIMEEMPSLAEMRETTAAPISVAEAGAEAPVGTAYAAWDSALFLQIFTAELWTIFTGLRQETRFGRPDGSCVWRGWPAA